MIPSRVNFLVPEGGYADAPLVGSSKTDLLGGDESQFPNITARIQLSMPSSHPRALKAETYCNMSPWLAAQFLKYYNTLEILIASLSLPGFACVSILKFI